MNQLANIKQTMSSREISELTGKRHDHVLRDCDNLNEKYKKLSLPTSGEGFKNMEDYDRSTRKQYKYLKSDTLDKIDGIFGKTASDFPLIQESYYTLPNTGNQQHRCYELTKMQTIDLMTGYNIELRIKINRRWEELETKPQTKEQLYLQTFQMLTEDVKALEAKNQELECINLAQEKKLETKSKKEDIANRMLGQGDTVAVTIIAKRHNLTARKLNSILREKGIQRKVGDTWVLNEPYNKQGYARVITKEILGGKYVYQLEWTLLGEAFIMNLLNPLKKDTHKVHLIPISANSSFIH